MKLLIWMVVLMVSGQRVSHHQSQLPGESVVKQSPCLECHGDLIEKEVVHPVAEDGCEDCHVSNGKSHPEEEAGGFTLMDSIPALCFYCHEEPAKAAFGHLPVEENECLACHDVHGSSEPGLLVHAEQDLCLTCHGGANGTGDGSNIKKLVTGDKLAHSAISMGGCRSCHLPHGSDEHALLVESYGTETYLPATVENFALCFQCHDADLLLAEETEWGTSFRDGTKNLHRIHIHGDRGRNCRMCHNMHGSSQPFLIEERIQYGDWEMEMHFEPQENGGSCLPGCHGKLQYQR